MIAEACARRIAPGGLVGVCSRSSTSSSEFCFCLSFEYIIASFGLGDAEWPWPNGTSPRFTALFYVILLFGLEFRPVFFRAGWGDRRARGGRRAGCCNEWARKRGRRAEGDQWTSIHMDKLQTSSAVRLAIPAAIFYWPITIGFSFNQLVRESMRDRVLPERYFLPVLGPSAKISKSCSGSRSAA